MGYLYEQVNAYDMERRAIALGRYHQLGGYDGIRALFEYYSNLAISTGDPVELDIIGMCDHWRFYAGARHAAEELGAPVDKWRTVAGSLAWLRRDHEVLPLPSGAVLVSVP